MRSEKILLNKKTIRLFATLCLLLALGISIFSPAGSAITCQAAKTSVVSVTGKNLSQSADKLNDYLMQQKAVTLNIRGKKSTSKKLLKQLKKQIKKTNAQGVIFSCDYQKTKGNTSRYTISSEQSSLYYYSVNFIKKLYQKERSKYINSSNTLLAQDYIKYPGEKNRMLRTAYEMMILWLDYRYTDSAIGSYDTAGHNVIIDTPTLKTNAATLARLNTKTYGTLKKCSDFSWIIKKITTSSDGTIHVKVKSFRQFKKSKKVVKAFTNKDFWYDTYYSATDNTKSSSKSKLSGKKAHTLLLSNQQSIIALRENFCSLSGAMKIWAIADSGYFSCSTSRPSYGMLYRLHKSTCDTGAKGMKLLYKNKAIGKCIHYASYEELVFKQLGIYVDKCAYFHHAWTVVRVKNSAGKILWIPFDYGIGPSSSLAVSASVKNKYLKTEAMRYKTYLCMTKGAPTYKNFTTSDFK
ncbi:MAG: hypothetical protein K6G01_08645 [Eubacterium sp.]|nr:hypothetical protein [Eubacterium sp.]